MVDSSASDSHVFDAGIDLSHQDALADAVIQPDAPLADANTQPDTNTPDTNTPDTNTQLDATPLADALVVDAPPVTPDKGPITVDMKAALDATIVIDAIAVDSVVATDAIAPDPGPVQCRKDSDCGGSMFCNTAAPGGICIGCATVCLDGLSCVFGTCVRQCSTDIECNAGFYCGGTAKCFLRSCSASVPCPPPYVCNADGKCSRPACATNGSCPAPLVCDGTLCMEP